MIIYMFYRYIKYCIYLIVTVIFKLKLFTNFYIFSYPVFQWKREESKFNKMLTPWELDLHTKPTTEEHITHKKIVLTIHDNVKIKVGIGL